MAIMASGIARGRVRTTTATTTTATTTTAELPNMAAILQKRDSLGSLNTSLILDIHTNI